MKDEHTKPPTTVREIGIHIGYMNQSMLELKASFEKMADSSPTNEEVNALKEQVKELQDWRDGIMRSIATKAILVLVAMVLALYGLDKFL